MDITEEMIAAAIKAFIEAVSDDCAFVRFYDDEPTVVCIDGAIDMKPYVEIALRAALGQNPVGVPTPSATP